MTHQRIGILGGTFDPIHVGHLALAHAAVSELKLDRVYFVPSYISPLGDKTKGVASAEIRLQMVQEAILSVPLFEASDIELKRGGVSYTIDTLREFRKNFPHPAELFFISGGDWGRQLSEWKDIDGIFSLCHFMMAARPGYDMAHLPKEVELLRFTPLNVSSSVIRARVANGESIHKMVPDAALAIIKQFNLYQKS